jgi:hypothetical protein
MLHLHGQEQGEAGVAWGALNLNKAAMLVGDSLSDRKP